MHSGDCLNATDFFSGATNGDGNGIIDNINSNGCENLAGGSESILAIDHLDKSDLYPANIALAKITRYSDLLPTLKTEGRFMLLSQRVFDGSLTCTLTGKNVYRLGTTDGEIQGASGLSTRSESAPIYNAEDAYFIDSKLDDGLPLTGVFYIGYNNFDEFAVIDSFTKVDLNYTGIDVSDCITGGNTNSYDVINKDKGCGIFLPSSL